MTYLLQRGINLVSGLASGLHGNYFGNDRLFMLFVYRLLQTPSFGLSAPDALNWMERSLCREHALVEYWTNDLAIAQLQQRVKAYLEQG